jgi:putative ABC transport system permease protein
MLNNYLKIALRNLLNHKAYSFINLFGLTTGLVCFLLIALYLFDELTFDAFHKDADRIYRVIEHKTSAAGKESNLAEVASNISVASKSNLPEVEYATRATELGRAKITTTENNQAFYEHYYIADASFFKVFDFPVVQGNPQSALSTPYSVVITEPTAIKLFGHTNVTGKQVRNERDPNPYTVTAVIKIPTNSHLQFNLLFSEVTQISRAEGFRNFVTSDWTSNAFATYLKLKTGHSPATTAAAIDKIVASHQAANRTEKSSFLLQPLKDIHFHSTDIDEGSQSSNLMHVYVFALVGLFVLLIACINYMNLTTARFSTRSKEIAVRKVAGAAQQQLIGQFITEALLLTVVATLLSLLAVKLLLPAFNAFTEKQLSLGIATDYRIWLGILCITIFVGLLAGSYPAFFQARLKPFLLLKNKITIGKGHLSLRRMLVVLQFCLSIIMIIATLVVYLQLKFIQQKDLGFKKEQLVVVDINSGAVRRGAETIKTEYSKLAAVKNVCVTSRVPGEWKSLPKVKVQMQGHANAEGEDMFFIGADDQFLNTYAIQLQRGRNFLPQSTSDSSAVLINETAARILGITAPGEHFIDIPAVNFGGNAERLNNPVRTKVIGIVKDFNFQSLRENVGPMVIAYQNNPIHAIDYFTVRVAAQNMSATLQQMETILHQVDAGHLFEYNFLDKQWELFYREDQKRQVIFLCIAGMTILIASLGLFGLVTFAARLRTKEIGIRKALGASISHIVLLLSKDFLKLVLIAAVLAAPLAGWVMYAWLQDFAYRIKISIWIFVVPGLLAVLIALITLSFQTIKAAIANPVKSLRTE